MFQSVTNMLRSTAGRRPLAKAPRRGRRLRTFETLETRRVFDASAFVSGTDLIIYGTAYNDVVEVTVDQGEFLVVSSSNERPGQAFNHFSGVKNIKFYGEDGNDQFINNTGLTAEIHGGRGRDYLNVGNSSKAIVYGDEGNDVLMGNDFDNVLDGGAGNDILYGFGGNDVLFGGANYDQIWGGRGRDAIFGGGGADMLAGEEDVDFLDGGVDGTPDTIYARFDGSNDVIVDERNQPTYGDRDNPGDRVLVSGADYESQFRATGMLPVSIGVTSSGYAIGGGISFKSAAVNPGVSVANKRINAAPTPIDATFANWPSAGLDQYFDVNTSVLPSDEIPIEGNYIEQTPVDHSEPLDGNLMTPVDASPTDPAIDAYYEQLALAPITPIISTPKVKPSLTTSIKRF